MPWRDEPSRAATLALLLTPFIRGIVPLVPLAVISGLQPGVGKNLLADCLSLVITGSNVLPLPWMLDDDEENAKKIHSAFREGHTMMCFDEAHVIGGSSLTRAITSTTYSDRILGVSKMASYPNNVTWIALGNQVSVLADMARRAYWIELYPDGPDPENRPEETFAHPDPRGWTLENRPELVTAALVLIRAWFTAGQPAYSRGALMGSFERWDKMMSGILGYAGVPGFLGNLAERRAERDTTGGFWTGHLAWLRERFGPQGFTTLDVKNRAMASSGTWEAPPHLEDPATMTFARDLGLAYARVPDRWFGEYRIVRGEGVAHRKVARWYVEYRGDGGSGGSGGTSPASAPSSDRSENPDGGSGGTGGSATTASPTPAGVRDNGGLHGHATPPSLNDTASALGFLPDEPATDFRPDGPCTGETPISEGVGGVEGVLPLKGNARAHTHARTRAHTREGVVTPPSTSGPSGLVIRADLETAEADRLYLVPRGEFVRLAGIIGPNGQPQIAPVEDVIAMLDIADRVDGHNFTGFDGPALAWHYPDLADWNRLAPKIRDTELIARQVKPPRSREAGHSADRYGLDAVAEEMGLPGKTDDLKRLARRHGGYGLIPQDDPEYRSYLEGDLRATAAVSDRLLPYYDSDPYLPREHLLARIAGQMSINGFAVDQQLLAERKAAVDRAKADAAVALHDGWGLPLSRMVPKGRGAARHEVEEVFRSPLATDEGKAWLEQQFGRFGVSDPPRTPKSRDLATGADMLRPIMADERCPASLREMLALMEVVTTARTVYQTASECLAPDGRVHPFVSMRQASGRWSVTNPGLTVFGKRGGRHVERDIFTADDEDSVILSCDLSQVDMRAMAGHCQDPGYMALFGWDENGKPLDPHTMIGEQVGLGREPAKAIGHGWNYGLGPARMIREGLDPEKVYAFANGMEARFPGLISWREIIREMGRAGQILDNGFGRRMMAEPSRAYTVAPALMGQGGARDIMCECLLRLPRELWPFLRVMVHDEIVLSVPRWAAEEIGHILREAMTWTWKGVPIMCDLSKPGRSWGEVSAAK
jgi:DNA polymerase I-like protein with 3'-5' exonuclease and polymerase domains